jgi:hypothetical protein
LQQPAIGGRTMVHLHVYVVIPIQRCNVIHCKRSNSSNSLDSWPASDPPSSMA